MIMNRIGLTLFTAVLLCFGVSCSPERKAEKAVLDVILHQVGTCEGVYVDIVSSPDDSLDTYSVVAGEGAVTIKATSATAACYAFNEYLQAACGGMISWSGKHLPLADGWPSWEGEGSSPYKLRNFLNVCTFGYTAPYWDWTKWEEEIELMALHGVNMPLATVASEAIARRVWLQLGLSEEEVESFFTGAAYLPWHRMGNLNTWSGPLNAEWHEDQIALQHKILDKMRSLEMKPVAPAFAGFIPPAYKAKHPELNAFHLKWGAMDSTYNAAVLSPFAPEFKEIGKLFVTEWEKEFGKNEYYLSDSFNEMVLPIPDNDLEGKCKLMAEYGKTIYESIASGNPDAVWVTQGWTFGNRHWFWERESLQALLSQVPDDKMIIIDLANDYPKWVWNIDLTWKRHDGFYGKKWIYSFTPNFGGKHLPTGDMNMYASGFAEALNAPNRGNLVGVGSAPEGLDNNDVVYELLADAAWTTEAVDLKAWYKDWCQARYGSASENMIAAWDKFHSTVYSSLYSYPRYRWQTVTFDKRRKSRHDINEEFGEGVKLFLSCREECADSPLYVADAIEFASFWLAHVADLHWLVALDAIEKGDMTLGKEKLDKTVELLTAVDRLLASHPERNLTDWVEMARAATDDPALKAAYETDAKRLVTTWGGAQEDYAARMWSGLIADYYIPRLYKHFEGQDKAAMLPWKEEWLASEYVSKTVPFENPLEEAVLLIEAN